MKMPQYHNSLSPTFTKNNHIFLVQRRTDSRLSARVLTQQTLACYTSSEAAIQHVQAEIKRSSFVNVNVDLDVDVGIPDDAFVSNQDGFGSSKSAKSGGIYGQCYREVAESHDPKLGKKKVALGVLRMELKRFFHEKDGDECDSDVGQDPELSEDCTGELEGEMKMDVDMDTDFHVDDDTLVDGNIDKILDWVGYLPAVECLRKGLSSRVGGDGDDAGGGGGGDEGEEEEKEKETYFREFHTMIERLHVHDLGHGQSLDPIVWPQERMLGDSKTSSGSRMISKKAEMKSGDWEIGTTMSSSKKRGRGADEDDRGFGALGESECRKSVKRARASVCAGATIG
ncbi:hypothetical protein IFR04_007807 [Cadophora malorum]|uniref:Uncharacterized protein n=1 Tax=Cadophora malorum TaxID=108018 RepID=A0A8H7THJ0_9HELO|nr:hypothetical protein IFR04_007807 [Cadophora malorum]